MVCRNVRVRKRGFDDGSAALECTSLQCVAHGIVSVVGGEDLVARLERYGIDHGVDAGGGIGHEHDIIGPGTDQPGGRRPGDSQKIGELAGKKVDRLTLHLVLERALDIADRCGHGPKRAVVQKGHARVEKKHGTAGLGQHHIGPTTPVGV